MRRSEAIPHLCQALWDRHLRVSPTTRSLAECGKLHRDNLEFNISLLDCRFICGDARAVRSASLPGDSENGGSRGAGVAAEADRPDFGAPQQIRPHHLSSGTQHQGLSRRPARLPGGVLAQPDFRTGEDGSLARAGDPVAGRFSRRSAMRRWIFFRRCDVFCTIARAAT